MRFPKKTKKTEVVTEEVKVETPEIVTVAPDEVGQMAQEIINETPVLDAPVIEDQPQVEKEPAKEPKAKKKGIRYAPLAILADPKAVIVSVAPNPKRPNTESFDLYARFMVPSVGLTIAEYEANFAANHRQGRHRARRLLRWDYAHGFVKLEAPAEQEAPAPEAQQEPETPSAE
jgi:hypothetical protein